MAESSAYSKIKTKINIDNLEKIGARQSISKLSNAVCIENLVKKNSLFAPSRLQPMSFEQTVKPMYNIKVTKYKKQIEPHQPKVIIPYIGKSMTSLLSESKPQFKQTRHRRNISAIWQNKKACREKKIETNQPPTTASFYLKKGATPIFYELKMDIKKVDAATRPMEPIQKKIGRTKYRTRNFPMNYQRVSSKQLNQEENGNDQISIEAKRSLEIGQNKQLFTQTDLGSDKNSMPIKINPKQRYIKSTLISYSSKGKSKKNKESIQIISDIYHIKNIIGLSEIHEESLQIFEQHMYFVNGFENNNSYQELINLKSANCISVAHFNQQTHAITPLIMKDPQKRVEIASITKVMTCLLVLNIVRLFRLNIHQQKALVSQKASKMPGTTANLQYSDILTIYELLHALMLPSGNDAAVALAQWGGKNIRKYCSLAQKYANTKIVETKSVNFVNDLSREKKSHIRLFIYHMNKAASVLKLKNTFFANAHGLMNQKAYSTSNDVSILTCIAMKNHIFAEIVAKKQFTCRINNRTYSQLRNVSWRNTNRLLSTEGFIGVKTGVTPSAGPCLSSMFSLNYHQSIVIVVLKTKSMEARFKESLQLLKQSLCLLKVGSNDLIDKLVQDDQSTAISLENQKAQEANLIAQPKQMNSEPENEQQQQDYQ